MNKYSLRNKKRFLDRLMAPSVSLMMRLSFTKKSFLLALIVSIAISTVTITLFNHLHKEIEIAQQELKGLELYPNLFKLIQLLQKHRGASAGVLGGAEDLSTHRRTLQQEVTNTIAIVERQLASNVATSDAWNEIDSGWNVIIDNGINWSVEVNFEKHVFLIKLTQKLINNLGDEYSLTNSSHLGTYYLLNTALYQLSPAQEYLGQVRAFGTGILAKQFTSKKQQLEINTLITQAQDAIEILEVNLNKAGSYNLDIKSILSDTTQKINDNTQRILNLFESSIYSEKYTLAPNIFFNSMSEAIDGSYETLYETLIPTAMFLIKNRLAEAEQTLLLSSVVVLVMLFILLYFSIGIYIATDRSMSAITTSTILFSTGKLNQRIKYDFSNEFLPIAKALNIMADNLANLIQVEKQGTARIQAIINSSQDALVQMNSKGEIIGWNHNAESIFGWSANEVLGQPLHDFIIPFRYRERHSKGLKHFLNTGKGPALDRLTEIEALHYDGHEFPIELTISPIKIEAGYEFNAFIRDISERKKSEDRAKLSSLVFGESHEGIIITDSSGNIIDVNPSVSLLSGYRREDIIGNNPSMFSSGKQSPQFYTNMWKSIEEMGNWQGEVWNRKKDGELYAELLNISSIVDDNGDILHYVGMFSDITENKQHQDTLQQLAHYDALTQLPNRTLFMDRFIQATAHSKRTSTQLAICFLDLDNFKPVNDDYGHEVGDDLLIEVSKRIQATIRAEDTVSRQGGDEFALLLGGIETLEQCEKMLSRLHQSLALPYMIKGKIITIGASSGVTLYPTDNADIDTLMRHADQAMYQSKLDGKNCFHFFNAEQDKKVLQKIDRLNEIEHALQNNQLCMYYQPKVNMNTGKVFGAEALIRWQHPVKGLIPPFDFLPILEGTALEVTIGNWVIGQALMQLDTWHKKNIDLEVSINVSSHHLQSTGFFSVIKQALAQYPDVDSHCLQLEILESSALGDITAISKLIKTCQDELGVRVALDDFGTGYSSLTHMRSLPAQTIKIDQSFVRDMLEDPNDYSIIDGIIGLAESFNREVIAEGVETTEHGLMLQLMGCDEAQGYGIARPMPAGEIAKWLNDYIPNQEWLINGQKDNTSKGKSIQLLKLTIDYWYNDIKNKLSFAKEHGEICSIEHANKTHINAWTKRARKEGMFSDQWLDLLSQKHEVMTYIGNGILDKYQSKDIESMIRETESLEVAYRAISTVLTEF